MKKILTLVAAIVFATATQAACYNWETSLGEGYDGMTWYVVNGAGSANIVSLLATDGNIEGFQTAMSGANVQTGTFQEGWGGWQDGLVTDASSSAYLVVINKLEAGATFYYSADLSTEDYQYTPPAGSPGALVFDSVSSGTIATAAVPEPTSGLLMLVGLAGLALRRRRA